MTNTTTKIKLIVATANKEGVVPPQMLPDGAGLKYMVTINSILLKQGTTDAHGYTAPFDVTESGNLEIKVFDPVKRMPVTPLVSVGSSCIKVDKGAISAEYSICLAPYYKYILKNTEGVAMPNVAYSMAKKVNGKEVELKGRSGKTDSKGLTAAILAEQDGEYVRFEIAKGFYFRDTPVQPFTDGRPWPDTVRLKAIVATTQPNEKATLILNGKQEPPILIDMAEGKISLLSQEDYNEFRKISSELEQVIEDKNAAKAALDKALAEVDPEKVKAAEKLLKSADEGVNKALNEKFKKPEQMKEVYVIEKYAKGKNRYRRRYMPTPLYKSFKGVVEHKLDIKFSGPADTEGKKGVKPATLNKTALANSFKSAKVEFAKTLKANADPTIFNFMDIAGNEFAGEIAKGENYEVTAQAQWMRYVGGMGASANIKFKDGKFGADAEAHIDHKAVLCEGSCKATYAIPTLKGWAMQFDSNGSVIDLGAIRFVLECELYGFAGAKLQVAAQITINETSKGQALGGINAPRQSYSKLVNKAQKLPQFNMTTMEAPKENKGSVDVDAFFGVQAGITPKGAVQWLPPYAGKDGKGAKFESFAEVSATLAGSLGAGANAHFNIFYHKGKFKIKASAGLCWGLGAKGGLEFTVDAGKIAQFVAWVYDQLLRAEFRQVLMFGIGAFEAFSQFLVLLAVENTPLGKAASEVATKLTESFNRTLLKFDKASERMHIVQNINQKPHWLTHMTPEARGMLLYQITRHGTPDHILDAPESLMHGFDPQLHYLPEHKRAILNILTCVQITSEWANVFEHMTEYGAKSTYDSGRKEGDVLRMLNSGKSLAHINDVMAALNHGAKFSSNHKPDTGNDYLDEYLILRGRCPDAFPAGYILAKSDADYLHYNDISGLESPTNMVAYIDEHELQKIQFNDANVADDPNKVWTA